MESHALEAGKSFKTAEPSSAADDEHRRFLSRAACQDARHVAPPRGQTRLPGLVALSAAEAWSTRMLSVLLPSTARRRCGAIRFFA